MNLILKQLKLTANIPFIHYQLKTKTQSGTILSPFLHWHQLLTFCTHRCLTSLPAQLLPHYYFSLSIFFPLKPPSC